MMDRFSGLLLRTSFRGAVLAMCCLALAGCGLFSTNYDMSHNKDGIFHARQSQDDEVRRAAAKDSFATAVPPGAVQSGALGGN